jgi:tripartite-type tricarboxylate transporter receptor subunit TctC
MFKSIFFLLLVLYSMSSSANSYTVVIPWAAGGATDHIWRTIYQDLSNDLQKQGIKLVTEYRAGAGGGLGVNHVAKNSTPHLVFTSASMVIAPHINTNLTYTSRDLIALAYIGEFPLVLVLNPKRFSSISEFQQVCRNKPLTIGNSGPGGMTYLATAILTKDLGCEVTSVPYRSASLALPDLIQQTIDAIIDHPVGTTKEWSTQGAIKMFPVRSLSSISNWHILAANTKMSEEDLVKIQRSLNKILTTGSLETRLRELGLSNVNMPIQHTWLESQWMFYKHLMGAAN